MHKCLWVCLTLYMYFKCRKVIRCECPCINWTKDEVVWWWRNWTNIKFVLGKWNICISHYEKIEKSLQFLQYASYGKISNYWPPPKFGLWFSECQWKWNICVCHYDKIEKWLQFHKYALYGKIFNYWTHPTQSLGLWFSECQWKWKICISIYE